jgi:hypothetical protein
VLPGPVVVLVFDMVSTVFESVCELETISITNCLMLVRYDVPTAREWRWKFAQLPIVFIRCIEVTDRRCSSLVVDRGMKEPRCESSFPQGEPSCVLSWSSKLTVY